MPKVKGYTRSCIMKEEQSFMSEFEKLGIVKLRKNKDGVVICNIPNENVGNFVDLYLRLMKPGRWNEYVGNQTGFYFKLATGETKHYLLNEENKTKINETLKIFIPNWDIDADLNKWLATVDIYSDWLS